MYIYLSVNIITNQIIIFFHKYFLILLYGITFFFPYPARIRLSSATTIFAWNKPRISLILCGNIIFNGLVSSGV